MALFGGGVMIGPILGPVLGGWLTDSFDWRWVFLVNIPVGSLAALMILRFMPKTTKSDHRFDLFGFALLGLALAGLQLMLDRGQHEGLVRQRGNHDRAGSVAAAAGCSSSTSLRPISPFRALAVRGPQFLFRASCSWWSPAYCCWPVSRFCRRFCRASTAIPCCSQAI